MMMSYSRDTELYRAQPATSTHDGRLHDRAPPRRRRPENGARIAPDSSALMQQNAAPDKRHGN